MTTYVVYGVYKGKRLLYIGCTCRPLHLRLSEHRQTVRLKKRCGYGLPGVTIAPIRSFADVLDADAFEQQAIAKYRPPCNSMYQMSYVSSRYKGPRKVSLRASIAQFDRYRQPIEKAANA